MSVLKLARGGKCLLLVVLSVSLLGCGKGDAKPNPANSGDATDSSSDASSNDTTSNDASSSSTSDKTDATSNDKTDDVASTKNDADPKTKNDNKTETKSDSPQTKKINSKNGAITGTISFDGKLPAPRVIQATKDPTVCKKGEGEVQDVIVTDGKLSGAVVELTIPRNQKLKLKFQSPKDGFVIHQKDCRFSPRVLIMHDGAELSVYNDDTVPHNVNADSFNVVQGPSKMPIKTKMKYAGVPFVRVTCNIHNWMETWVYLAKSPLHSASGKTGTFKIENIPPGKYRGAAIHPTLGKQRFSVEVKAGESLTQDFTFEAK